MATSMSWTWLRRIQWPALPDYQYTPLPGPTWTRVLTLHPQQQGRLTVTMEHMNIAHPEPRPYVAISYAWQGQAATELIICNGCNFRVSKTLLACLNTLQERSEPIVLWVDAICIDQRQVQSALLERNQQVSMMGVIYSLATKVIAYLGPTANMNGDMSSAVSLLFSVSQEEWNQHMGAIRTYLTTIHEGNRREVSFYHASDTHLTSAIDKLSSQLRSWLDRPYFSRLWIVQELVMGREFEIMVDRGRIDAHTFKVAIDRLTEYTQLMSAAGMRYGKWRSLTQELYDFCIPRLSIGSGFRPRTVQIFYWFEKSEFFSQFQLLLNEIFEARRKYHNSVARDLDSALYDRDLIYHFQSSRYRQATDVRDHIFALVNLSSDRSADALTVNYEISPKRLSDQVAIYMLQRAQGITLLLNYCQAATFEGHGWRLVLQHKPTNTLWDDKRSEIPLYKAHGDTRMDFSIIEAAGRPIRLSFLGQSLGHIESMCEQTFLLYVEPNNSSITKFHGVTWWFSKQCFLLARWFLRTREWIRDQHKHFGEIPGGTLLACWRTIFADQFYDERGNPSRISQKGDMPGEPDFTTMTLGYILLYTWDVIPGFSPWWTLKLFSKSIMSFIGAAKLARGRNLARMKQSPCLVPKTAIVKDEIVLLHGCPMPLVLRPLNDNTYIFIGTCFVHGMMDGEAIHQPDQTTRRFEIWPGNGPDDL